VYVIVVIFEGFDWKEVEKDIFGVGD